MLTDHKRITAQCHLKRKLGGNTVVLLFYPVLFYVSAMMKPFDRRKMFMGVQ